MNIHSAQTEEDRSLRIRERLSCLVPCMVLVLVLCTGRSFATDDQQSQEPWGTTACSSASTLKPKIDLPAVVASRVFRNSGYSTGGVSLRNRGGGGISISGIVAPVKAAYIYWAVISSGPPPKPATFIKIEQEYPAEIGPVVLPGAVVGSGPPPCWPGTVITVFEAAIPPSIVAPGGNGLYNVQLLPGAAGDISGSDPWLVGPVLPLWEGASIVMVGAGPGTVSIYDFGFAGATFMANLGFAYTLALPLPTPGVRTLIDNIGADGQHGLGGTRKAVASMSDEMTMINGIPFAGPGSPYNDSDWNGSSGFPVTELWDDTGHDITPVGAGVGALKVTIFNGGVAPGDCLTTVVNVVEED